MDPHLGFGFDEPERTRRGIYDVELHSLHATQVTPTCPRVQSEEQAPQEVLVQDLESRMFFSQGRRDSKSLTSSTANARACSVGFLVARTLLTRPVSIGPRTSSTSNEAPKMYRKNLTAWTRFLPTNLLPPLPDCGFLQRPPMHPALCGPFDVGLKITPTLHHRVG